LPPRISFRIHEFVADGKSIVIFEVPKAAHTPVRFRETEFIRVELFQLPAPDFSVTEKHTRAVLFAHRRLGEMTPQDRIRACYQHAGLQWVSNEQMTNTSLRRRFGITDQNSAQASRIIRDTLEAGLIKESDPTNTSRRHSRYVPYWA
jgi:ATP-dependent DNA helicase RecG